MFSLPTPTSLSPRLQAPAGRIGPSPARFSCPTPKISGGDLQMVFFAALSVLRGLNRGVLRGPSRPFVDKRKLQSPLQFSAALRVLRGQRCCRCKVLRGPSWPFVDKKVLHVLRVLRGPSWTKRGVASLPFSRPSVSSVDKGVAVAVLRGPSRALRGSKKVFSAALRGPSWTKGRCRCRCFAALRGPPWTKGSCSRRCRSPRPSVSSVDKCVAVAVLRGPSRPFVD